MTDQKINTLEQALEYAAKYLPEGITLSVNVENGSSWLEVDDIAEGYHVDLDDIVSCDEALPNQIISTVKYFLQN
jgi:hypothetical protein